MSRKQVDVKDEPIAPVSVEPADVRDAVVAELQKLADKAMADGEMRDLEVRRWEGKVTLLRRHMSEPLLSVWFASPTQDMAANFYANAARHWVIEGDVPVLKGLLEK